VLKTKSWSLFTTPRRSSPSAAIFRSVRQSQGRCAASPACCRPRAGRSRSVGCGGRCNRNLESIEKAQRVSFYVCLEEAVDVLIALPFPLLRRFLALGSM